MKLKAFVGHSLELYGLQGFPNISGPMEWCSSQFGGSSWELHTRPSLDDGFSCALWYNLECTDRHACGDNVVVQQQNIPVGALFVPGKNGVSK